VRIKVSNEFGDATLRLATVQVGIAGAAGAIADEHVVRFAGQGGVAVPPGDIVVSDPVSLAVPAFADLVVTTRAVAVPGAITGHPGSRATSLLMAGDRMAGVPLDSAIKVEHWYLLSRVDVLGGRRAVVSVLGNSIADGRGSGTDRNTRWPDELARRLARERSAVEIGVLNAGIGGNAVVRGGLGPTALERLDRDVLQQPGTRWLILSEGVNDIGTARGADSSASIARQLVAAYAEIVRRAHARGIRVYGATMLPFGGSFYDSPDHEAARQTVNAWIRQRTALDGVIDFDVAMRDPANAMRLRAEVDGGDHLHPNETGYRRMAAAVDLELFRH
jgi:lysophospholipase L1-like esterase